MVYKLDVMAPIFIFVVLVQLPRRDVGMIHFVYLAVGVRTRSSSPKVWCIERLNSLNTLTEHNESTSTWFGLTEQHDRSHVTPNQVPRTAQAGY